MTPVTQYLVFVTALAASVRCASADGFLQGTGRAEIAARDAEFTSAMDAMMGCGADAMDIGSREGRLSEIEKALASAWRALPKNQKGNVEWRMLRYVAHRYFLQKSSVLIRGFEPARLVDESQLGSADVLGKQQPLLVEKLIASRQSADGFTLQDAVAMIATLEQVIFDSESVRLETVYKQQKKSTEQSLSHDEVNSLIESYMVHWMIGDDPRTVRVLMKNKSLLDTAFPHWSQIKGFASGMIRSMEFEMQRSPVRGHGRAALADGYSFHDVHHAVGSITNTFASYWETECQAIKSSLVELDKSGTGRIPLKDFYGANADGEWRFGESETYLRELGALDESSVWRGKQVIIPNYLLGASNCIVTTPHYLVCCVNECEDVLSDIEDTVGAPMAVPSIVLGLVANLSNFDDDKPKLDSALQGQLHRIGEAHGGKVPLHGRLFAQWLHYVFPRECPFPHRAGAFTSLTPAEFGDQYIASDTEVNTHASRREDAEAAMGEAHAAEEEWMSQWSEDEEHEWSEIHSDYAAHLSAPWQRGSLALGGAGAATLALLLFVLGSRSGASGSTTANKGSYKPQAHFV